MKRLRHYLGALQEIDITMADFLEEYLDDYNLSQNKLAKKLGVSVSRINAIMKNRAKVTVDTDLRLCSFFNKKDGYFLRLQNAIDIKAAKIKLNGGRKD